MNNLIKIILLVFVILLLIIIIAILLQKDTTPPVISDIHIYNIGTSATSTIINWRTNEDSDGLVNYGTIPGSYSFSAPGTKRIATGTAIYCHEVNLSSLIASTTYYLQLSSTDNSGNNAESSEESFTTYPVEMLEWMEQIKDSIEISQEAYFLGHGDYWHRSATHTSVPNKMEILDNRWDDLIVLPYELPFRITVSSYEAPGNNFGYWIVFENEYYTKSVGYGVQGDIHTFEIYNPPFQCF